MSEELERHKNRIVKHLGRAGGKLPHTVLFVKNQFALSGETFKVIIELLKKEGIVEETWTHKEHAYILTMKREPE